MDPDFDRHGALCEAVDHVLLWQARTLVELDLTEAAHALRRAITYTSMGWGSARSFGSTTPRGFQIRAEFEAEPVLVTWREIAGAILAAWRPEFTDLYDHAFAARVRLRDACAYPVDWPKGATHYFDLLHRIGNADAWIRNELLLNVAALDPKFHVEPQGVLW